MANMISGNAGMAAALVTLSGAASATTTSAANGTYSFAGLAAGAYVVTPTSTGITFTPTHLNETIVVSDIANVNFVAQPTVASFTPTISYNFNHADVEPLPSPPWTNLPNPGLPGSELAIVGNQCVAAADPGIASGFEVYTAVPFTNDQSVEGVIGAFVNDNLGSEVGVFVRANLGDFSAGYFAAVFNTEASTRTFELSGGSANVSFVVGDVTPGDKLRLQAVGSLITAFYNDVPLWSFTETTYTSGLIGLEVAWGTVQTDTSVSLFTAGAVNFSISGSVGATGAGDTVTLGGAASASTTGAGGTGNYSFANLGPGTYYITPSHAGKAYSPAQQTVVITNANITGINFTLFTPSGVGSNSGRIMATRANFATRIESPNTSLIGTNLGTRISK